MTRTLTSILRWAALLSLPFSASLLRAQPAAPLGIFQGQSDVGTVLHPGVARFDPATGTYTVSGNGENMWAHGDDFHFVWLRGQGDVALTADIEFAGSNGNAHRKAALMLRQSLATDSAYVDAARHGDGLTSLQYRDAAQGDTHEIETTARGPHRLRIEKRGSYAYVLIPDSSGKMVPSGAAMAIDLTGTFYVGLGVCSHDKDATETVRFSNVALEPLHPTSLPPILSSTLETVLVASTDRRVRYTAAAHMDAPDWTRDGTALIFNQDGTPHRWRLDNGIHPIDSTLPLAIAPTAASAADIPRRGIPELSPDGKWIYFSSARNGVGQLWRKHPDGSGQEQVLRDDRNDGAPHLSPDGKSMIWVSSATSSGSAPAALEPVEIRMMVFADGKVRTLARLTGGQDTLGIAPWSPDSSMVAFVSYQSRPTD